MADREWIEGVLTREDIGYGPAQPYEYAGPAMKPPARERRSRRSRPPHHPASPPRGMGPYFGRLRRRQRPDAWIRAEVEEILFLDTWINADRITVAVTDSVVTLIGTLPNREEISRALDDARRVTGVAEVRNALELGP